MAKTDPEQRIERLYAVLDEAPKRVSAEDARYKISQRESMQDNELRGFLLQIHEDPRIADFVKTRRLCGAIYDSAPDNDSSWTLDWEAKNNEVDFVYLRSVWGMGKGGDRIPFDLVGGRFYAVGKELLDLFPKLTAPKLEDCVKQAFREEKKFRLEHP